MCHIMVRIVGRLLSFTSKERTGELPCVTFVLVFGHRLTYNGARLRSWVHDQTTPRTMISIVGLPVCLSELSRLDSQ